MESNQNDLVKTSVSILTAALIQDKGFRFSWQSSIATAIREEFAANWQSSEQPPSDRAANRFLEQLCQTKFEVL